VDKPLNEMERGRGYAGGAEGGNAMERNVREAPMSQGGRSVGGYLVADCGKVADKGPGGRRYLPNLREGERS
jgi:hypothetical protein